ncbi:hypothetical protein BDP27DRAFT_253528 [Rhodocollybia butyracea]|uniref:Uncharacterized protein n=1 Tax=Rhodocollybia butyracea TaxID=206335 RepID=A0A9P5PCG9_9AGAR|nr:hypothetical protein BDP27DRAFT_253528 [Rhodocollybia butyracea]
MTLHDAVSFSFSLSAISYRYRRTLGDPLNSLACQRLFSTSTCTICLAVLKSGLVYLYRIIIKLRRLGAFV